MISRLHLTCQELDCFVDLYCACACSRLTSLWHSSEKNSSAPLIGLSHIVMDASAWAFYFITYDFSAHACIINRSPKHGRMLWLSWYIRKEIHQTSKTTDQSVCFPLYTRHFQTFFYKGCFVRWTSTNHVSKSGFRAGYSIINHLRVVNQLARRRLMSSRSHFVLPSSIMKKPSTAHWIWTTLWKAKEPGRWWSILEHPAKPL